MELVPRICSNSEEESPTMAQNSTIFAPTISLLNISAHLTNLSERFHDDPFHYNVHRASFTDDGSCKKRRLSTISVDSISIKLRHKRKKCRQLQFVANDRHPKKSVLSDEHVTRLYGQHIEFSERNHDTSSNSHALQRRHDQRSQRFLQTVHQAANEIRMAGMERGHIDIAQKMSFNLLDIKETDEQTILEYCVKLYTTASFVYRVCHQDLNDYCSCNDAKVSHYIELLNRYMEHCEKLYSGTVYRGASVDSERLKWYLVRDIHTEWYSSMYLSTSKSRSVAEIYGNVLFIIDIKTSEDFKKKAIDISALSAIPDEEEVLIAPKYKFYREKESEFDPILNKPIIYLTSVRPFKFPDTESVYLDAQSTRSWHSSPSSSSSLKRHHGFPDSCDEDEFP